MSDILAHILARRSIRKFTAEPVSKEQITQLLQAAMAAPSATNRKPWEFLVVTEAARLAKLRGALPLGRYEGTLAVVVCGNMKRALPWPARDFWIQDCSAATQNILLAAAGMGLGGVWVGVHPIRPLAAAVSRALDIPKGIAPLSALWIGHPAETKEPRTQYDESRVHWQTFSAGSAGGDLSPAGDAKEKEGE